MELHCLFQRFIRRVPLRKLTIRMADFGSDTAKPTILYSSFLLIKFRATCIYFPCNQNPKAHSSQEAMSLFGYFLIMGKSSFTPIICNYFTKPGNRSQGYWRPPQLQDSPSTCWTWNGSPLHQPKRWTQDLWGQRFEIKPSLSTRVLGYNSLEISSFPSRWCWYTIEW